MYAISVAAKQFTYHKLSRLFVHVFRTKSFKVLNIEMNSCELDMLNADKKSNQTTSVLKVLTEFVKAGGGSKSIERHTKINKKLLVRQRLKLLCDPDTPFLEIGLFAGMFMDYGTIPAAGSVAVIGKIHGQFCIVGAFDATVKGGTVFPVAVTKQLRLQQLSYLNNLPCIYLVDSGGAYLPLQADIFPDKNHGGRTFYNEAILSSLGIPQIAVVCGSSTAGGAYCPTMAEEAIIVNKLGYIFLAGPPLVKAATGEVISAEDLGGANMHCSISGCTDYYAEKEEDAFEMCRESILTLNLPQCSKEIAFEEPLYPEKDLLFISEKEYMTKDDMYVIISRILDGSMFKHFKEKFGNHLITGFGFIHGILVGLIANCGALTYQDAQKGAHFIQLCEKRHIPLIFLQNSGHPDKAKPNKMDYVLEDSTLRDRAKMVGAHSCAKIPKIAICINGCYEDDNFTMCGWPFEPNFFFSWPLAHISSSREGIAKAKTDEAVALNKLCEAENINDYEMLFENKTSAFYHASRMMSDGIISPQQTRQVLALCLEIAQCKSHLNDSGRSCTGILRM